MSVTINTLGTSSRQIVINLETGPTNIINAVNTCLVALGWTLIDTVSSGARDCFVTKVYSAPNDDGVTTKYMIIRYDTPRQIWFVSCCESWNTVTHVATNEAWHGNNQITLPLQYSNCLLYVFATARYACFMGVVRSEPGPWQGIFEFERAAAEDIADNTVPCFGWTSSLTIGEPYGNIVTVGAAGSNTPTTATTSTNNGYVAVGFATPRTKNGLTGVAASGNFALLTGLGSFPPPSTAAGADFTSGGVLQANNPHSGMLGSFGENQSFVWNPNKTVISNLSLSGYQSAYVTGKIFGLKITTKLGSPLETISIPVDSDLFYDPLGANKSHYLMGIHGGYLDRLSAGPNKLQANPTVPLTAIGVVQQAVVVSGRFIYMATSTGFHKFDMLTQGFSYNILPAGAYNAVKFDGENSLYVTANTTTIWKINLTDDSSTSITDLSTSVAGIALDDMYLYAASSATGGTVTIKRITLSTFTETASWDVAIGTSNYVTHLTTADYSGYLYVGALYQTTATSTRILRILSDTGSATSIIGTQNRTQLAASAHSTWFDGDFIYLYSTGHTVTTSTATGVTMYKVAISNFTASAFLLTVTPSYVTSFTGVASIQGCLDMPNFAGLNIFPVTYADGVMIINRLVYYDAKNPTGWPAIPWNGPLFDSSYNYGNFVTDGVRLIGFTQTYNPSTTASNIIQYTGAFRNFNFNGAQSSNLLIAQ